MNYDYSQLKLKYCHVELKGTLDSDFKKYK